MKQTICYLYEYEYNRQSRNVGFIKCIFHQDRVTFQIHGKGLERKKTVDLEMFLFVGTDNGTRLDKVGIVEGARGNVNYKVTVDHMNMEMLNEYDGAVLVAPSTRRYVATWKHKEVHLDHIEERKEQEVCSESKREEQEIRCELKQEEQEVCCELKQEVCCELKDEEQDVCCEVEYQEELQDVEYYESERNSRYTYEKIQRQDIARLQQREWKIANNNFLIHGYANYKHLIYIRQDENLYLGIPGVFHKKEAEIAHSFGFSNFHKVEDEQFLSGLEACEYSPEEGFGYWCRPVVERRGR